MTINHQAKPYTTLKVGLTGGIGSGKSTVAEMFQRLGVPTLDMDAVSRELTRPGQPVLQEIARRFGSDLVDAGGVLDRRRLASIIFQDTEARHSLEALLHPLIREASAAWIQAQINSPTPPPIVILEIPLLFESKLENTVDRIVLVTANPTIRVERLARSRNLTAAEAQERINSQMPDSEKIPNSHFVIYNDGDPASLEARVREIWQTLTGGLGEGVKG